MANYFLSYDLNGQNPTHAQMDDHLRRLNCSAMRVLETVWYVRYPGTKEQLFGYVNRILSPNDRLLVIDANDAFVRNLLVPLPALQSAWAA